MNDIDRIRADLQKRLDRLVILFLFHSMTLAMVMFGISGILLTIINGTITLPVILFYTAITLTGIIIAILIEISK